MYIRIGDGIMLSTNKMSVFGSMTRADNFVDVVNGLMHIQNTDICITGSNSRFLSSDIVTELRGRGDEVRTYPLTFSEY